MAVLFQEGKFLLFEKNKELVGGHLLEDFYIKVGVNKFESICI